MLTGSVGPARRERIRVSYTVRLMMSAGRTAGQSPGQGWSGARQRRGRAPNPYQESHAHFSGSRKSEHVTPRPQSKLLLGLASTPASHMLTRSLAH